MLLVDGPFAAYNTARHVSSIYSYTEHTYNINIYKYNNIIVCAKHVWHTGWWKIDSTKREDFFLNADFWSSCIIYTLVRCVQPCCVFSTCFFFICVRLYIHIYILWYISSAVRPELSSMVPRCWWWWLWWSSSSWLAATKWK